VNRRTLVVVAGAVTVLASACVLIRGTHSTSADRGIASVETTPAVAAQPAPSSSDKPANVATPEPMATALPVPQTNGALTDLDPREALGSKSAPIVMEVFSDFQCPACKTLFTSTNRQLMDNYVSTGKVYLIHRDFPLPMHAHSRVAAQYSRAAAQIGKLEPVEEVLFQNQEKWEQNGDVDGTVASVLSATEMTKVRALVKSGTVDAAIEKDKALGNSYRVNQTPTTIFHAHGQTIPYAGVMNWDILHQFLDQLLSQK
jgi:protein-disulfide isomerase